MRSIMFRYFKNMANSLVRIANEIRDSLTTAGYKVVYIDYDTIGIRNSEGVEINFELCPEFIQIMDELIQRVGEKGIVEEFKRNFVCLLPPSKSRSSRQHTRRLKTSPKVIAAYLNIDEYEYLDAGNFAARKLLADFRKRAKD